MTPITLIFTNKKMFLAEKNYNKKFTTITFIGNSERYR